MKNFQHLLKYFFLNFAHARSLRSRFVWKGLGVNSAFITLNIDFGRSNTGKKAQPSKLAICNNYSTHAFNILSLYRVHANYSMIQQKHVHNPTITTILFIMVFLLSTVAVDNYCFVGFLLL